MVALQEDVPVVPAAIHGVSTCSRGTATGLGRLGAADEFEGFPVAGKGYREARC